MICKLGNVNINYEIYGKGINIIILHGYQVDHKLMEGCLEKYFKDNENYKRIYIDLPGMGKSTGEGFITNADEMLQVITSFIDKVIPNESFLLIGQSYGGYLSRGLVTKISERIDGLFLLAPVVIPEKAYRNVPVHSVLKRDNAFLNSLYKAEADDFHSSFVCESREIYNRYENEIKSGLKLGRKEFLERYEKYGYGFSFNVDDKKYNKPTLIITGRQDSCVGYKDTYSILENYPRATFAVIDCAGHNVQIEQRDVFEALIKQWLERIK